MPNLRTKICISPYGFFSDLAREKSKWSFKSHLLLKDFELVHLRFEFVTYSSPFHSNFCILQYSDSVVFFCVVFGGITPSGLPRLPPNPLRGEFCACKSSSILLLFFIGFSYWGTSSRPQFRSLFLASADIEKLSNHSYEKKPPGSSVEVSWMLFASLARHPRFFHVIMFVINFFCW